MEMKNIDWRPGPPMPSVCRCCLAEGCYKDISTEYFWMGKREVYSEMLSDTFDVSISYSTSAGPNSNSRLICELCISRLRDASEFKKQVFECEKTFKQHLDPGRIIVEIEPETVDKDVKLEDVKLEKKLSDVDDNIDDIFDADVGFSRDDDDDDDDMDNQPLVALASKKPKKESVDVQELLDSTVSHLKRKSGSKDKSSPRKKTKTSKLVAKTATTKTVAAEKKKKGSTRESAALIPKELKPKQKLFERCVNQNPQRLNAVLILKHSTAIPFKTRFNRIVCSYCHDEFQPMAALRDHIKAEHANADFNSAFYKVTDDLKIDITELKCNACTQDIQSVDSLMNHISTEHSVPVNFDVPFGVLPYRQGPTGLWMCLDCEKSFVEFSQINGHLRTHIKIFTCEKCSATFLSEQGARQHERKLKCYKSTYKPRYGKALKHRNNTEIILQYSTAWPFRTWGHNFNCIFCRVQSNDPNGLRSHMAARHINYEVQHVFNRKLRKDFLKVDITDLQCKLCFTSIDTLNDLISHLKNDHKQPINMDVQPGVLPFKLNDGSIWKCAICFNQFSDFMSLKKHTTEHFQNYVCDSCGEGFVTQTALIAHAKVPHDNKYSCSRCVATFTTLEERKIHIQTLHAKLPYMCVYCKDKPRFATWELRKRHLMEFHNYKPGLEMYECTTCHMTFKTRSQKYHHNVKAHREKKETKHSYQCESCSRTFASKFTLDKHVAKKHFAV